MQIILQIIIIIVALTSDGFSINSFFMNDAQSKLIMNMINEQQNSKQPESRNKTLILSGIFYIDEEHWTIWINNNQYTSIGQNDDFSIDEVTEDSVTITLLDGQTIILTVSDNIEVSQSCDELKDIGDKSSNSN